VSTLLTLLALLGIGAALWHMARATLRFLRHGAVGLWAGEVGRTRARRGDLTAVEESRGERERAKRSRRRAGVEAVGWLALLIVPTLTPWARPVYAAYAALWALPLVRRGGA
jgi:hypothetical protein